MIYVTEKIYNEQLNKRTAEWEGLKANIYKENLDGLTCRMNRKIHQNTWTEQDQVEYDNAYQHCLALIEEQRLMITPLDVKIISDEEYEKKLKEHKEKMEAQRKKMEEEGRDFSPSDGMSPDM